MAVLAIGVYYAYNKYVAQDRWKPYLQQELKSLILKTTDSLYSIEYSDFDLNIASGDVTLTNFKLKPDTNVYLKMVANKKAPDNLFTLGVKKLSIKNLGAKRAYQDKILNIKDITIEKPSLTVVNKRFSFNDTVKVGKPKSPYEIIKKTFKQLRIDSISLKDISLNYINRSDGAPKTTALKNLDIHISDVLIDSLSGDDPNRFYYTKGVDVKVKNYSVLTGNKLYKISLKQILFSTARRSIILDKVAYTPLYSKSGFYKKTGKPGERFTLNFRQIAITDIDLQRFLRDQKLYAGVMNLKNGYVEIYSNNKYKGPKTIKIGKDPHQALQKVALDMRLKRLNINSTDIKYLEADANTGITGEILFKNTDAVIMNLTNDPAAKKVNPFMTARINTRFMNAGNLNVNFRFNLNAKDGSFNYNGTLGKFNGQVLDKLVKPLALVHVKSADIDKLHFNVNANNYRAKGQLEFYYHNLSVDLLKKQEGVKELQRQGLISRVANTFFIDNDNPSKNGKFRPGPINVARDPHTSFFSFLYKGLLDGLKPSVGYDKKNENFVNQTVAQVTSVLDKFKQFKENRKKRREERKKEKALKKAAEEKEEAAKKLKEAQEKAEKEKQKAAEKAAKEKEKQQNGG
ncbi:hypothetical protein DYU05_19705 [Mucilaginibacter terrenus]|uniref:DUF748 domain-containing protein n=1 Tax=Mucilaginibacter terrenus TaxID=2482727 RepID=A0A3E2NJW4_9SPHI|nr:hypothetical protein DYU05_19705 [Mucilaginibacter terrenus]